MSKNILIVDDEGLVTKSLQRMLKQQGYNTVIAGGGKEAVEMYKKSDFDLIVCDVQMPGMDGIETIETLRGIRDRMKRRKIPEIFITGVADEQKYTCALNMKVAGYLLKPFDREEFIEVIKRNLDVHEK
jgi:CheY-like chemotaxis protein